jgi:hypothetical protein
LVSQGKTSGGGATAGRNDEDANIPLTSSEEARRMVDKESSRLHVEGNCHTERCLRTLSFGAGIIVDGKDWREAKKQFELARERLPLVDESERKNAR